MRNCSGLNVPDVSLLLTIAIAYDVTSCKPVYIHRRFGETHGFILRKNGQHTHKEKFK